MSKRRHGPAAAPGPAAQVRRVHVVLAVLVCAALYLPTLGYDFVWDDRQLVSANPRLETANPLSFFSQSFIPGLHGSEERNVRYYRPVTVLSFWLDKQVWGLRPFGFHLTNVLLNALALVLLALLLEALGFGLFAVLSGVVFWGAHATRVESVAFVSGRTDLLAAVFVLVSFIFTLRYARTGRWPELAGAGLAFGAALLCKEAALLLPLVGLVAVVPRASERKTRIVALAVALAAVAAGYLVLRFLVVGTPVTSGSVFARLPLVVNSLGRYAGLVVFPFFHRLIYSDRAGFGAPGWPTVAGVLACGALCWAVARSWRNAQGLGAAWFIAFLLPAANVFPVGVTLLAERFLLVPLAGAAMMVCAAAERSSGRARIAVIVLLAAFCAASGAGAICRMRVWRDPVTLFRTMARESDGSAEAHLNLGAALLVQKQDTAGAEAAFRRALELRPTHPVARNNLGDILRKRGELDGARREYEAAVAADPGYAEARGNLGVVLLQLGDAPAALGQLRQARAFNPALGPAHVNIGNCFMALGEPDSAIVSLWTALRLQPGMSAAYLNLMQAYEILGKTDSAELVRRMLDERQR